VSAHLETAFGIGAEICRDAIWWEDRCNWLGDTTDVSFGQKDKLRTQSLGPSLYNGTIGVAIFLAQLGARTGEKLFSKHAVAAARQAIDCEDDDYREPHSFHSGRFGVAFGLTEIGSILKHEELSQTGREWLEAVSSDTSDARGLDVIAGAAGALLGLADLAQRHGVEPPLDYLRRLAGQLHDTAHECEHGISWENISAHDGPNLNGYAHGVSGNIAALHLANRWLEDEKIRRLVSEGLRYERAWYSEEQANWPDFRKESEPPPEAERKYMTAWCHGAPGIGLARLQLSDFDASVETEARRAFQTTAKHIEQNIESRSGNYSLCHGIAGNTDILISASQCLRDKSYQQLIEAAGIHGTESFGGHKPAWPNGYKWPGHTPSLMMGLAGTGYFYLRLDAPNQTPSLLAPGLQIPTCCLKSK